jgi:hypothetical protein
MKRFLLSRHVLPGVLALALAACAKEDGGRIVGTWRAERLEVMSLKLPVGPELRISREALTTAGDVKIPIAGITQDGDEVTLDTDAMVGMTFYFVEADRMYLDVPLLGRVYYRRVTDTAAGTNPGVRQDPAAEPAPANARQPILPSQAPAVPPVREAVAPPRHPDYTQALVLLREGDRDGAVRSLNSAFRNGFHDLELLAKTPEFDALASDPRYQALLARYANP